MKLVAAGILVLVVLSAGYLYHEATTPFGTLPAIAASSVQAAAAQKKLDAMRSSAGEARRTGHSATVAESFTDGELTSLANQELENRSLPVDKLVLHATASGTIESEATAHWGGQTLPLFLVITVQVVEGDQVQLEVIESRLGRLSVPEALSDQINSLVRHSLDLGGSLEMQELRIAITEGLVTISGVVRPAA